MCRLLAVVAPRPVTASAILGDDGPGMFQEMAHLHDDGWGSAWTVAPGSAVHRERAATTGVGDVALTRALTDEPAVARIVHLRLASDGMSCVPTNTHPFLADGMAFAHNGAVIPEREMDDLIAADILARLEGTTDSERYFAVLRTVLRESLSIDEAVVAGVTALRRRYPVASMNALMLTPDALVVIHSSRGARIPYDDFESSGLGDRLPTGHDESYYRMHVRRGDDGSLAFASTGLEIADWDEMPAESVTVVDLATLTMRTTPIAL